MKKLTNKITMLFAVLFVLALTPALKAEAYGVDQTAATADSATITWTQVTDSDCVGYLIYLNGTAITTDLLPVTTTSYTITGLSQGIPYDVQVCSYDVSSYTGKVYEYSEGKTTIRTIPTKVTTTEVSWTKSDRITLYVMDPNAYMDASGYTYKYADGYEIKIKDKNGKVRKTISEATNYGGYAMEYFTAHSKLKNKGMIYTIKPYITLDNGVKVYGETTTKVAVPQAKITKIKSSGSSYRVTWKKVTGATGYTIYRVTSDDEGNWTKTKKIKKVSKNTTSYTVKKSYMNNRKKGIMIIANGVKIKGKKYNSTKSYYTYTY